MKAVSWKTAVSGIGAAVMALLAFVAQLSYENGAVATLIPPEYKTKVAIAAALAAAILKGINGLVAKDADISGTGDNAVRPADWKSNASGKSGLVILLCAALALVGCASAPIPPPRTATLTWHGVTLSYTLAKPEGLSK